MTVTPPPPEPVRAPAPTPARTAPSPWKRRLVVAGLYLVALGLLAGYLFAVRPNAINAEVNVDSVIKALGSPAITGPDRENLTTTLANNFKQYRQQTDFALGLLVGAFFVGALALAVGGVWGFIEARRSPR